MQKEQLSEGIKQLSQPILPLVRIVQLLFLTGPFNEIEEILDELNEPIETNAALYENPKEALSPYLKELKAIEQLKQESSTEKNYIIYDSEGNQIDSFEALNLMVSNKILIKELEAINSKLCGPCQCDPCCTGPHDTLQHDFFEIPLTKEETALFPLQKIDTEQSRVETPYSDTVFQIDSRPFYQGDTTLIHWKQGWSLILPKSTTCPHLQRDKRICTIYPDRPDVCRRPQIFSYLLEKQAKEGANNQGAPKEQYTWQNKLLAIWDCPYVKLLKDEIAAYAEMCELEPVFKKNKE